MISMSSEAPQQSIDANASFNDVYVRAIRRCDGIKDPSQLKKGLEDAKKRVEEARKKQNLYNVKVDTPASDSE
jgi:hypothetical protein